MQDTVLDCLVRLQTNSFQVTVSFSGPIAPVLWMSDAICRCVENRELRKVGTAESRPCPFPPSRPSVTPQTAPWPHH